MTRRRSPVQATSTEMRATVDLVALSAAYGIRIERFCFRCPSEATPRVDRYLWRGTGWPDGGLREAEFTQITRSTLFDVSWPGGKVGTLSGAVSVRPRARVVSEDIYQNTAPCSLAAAWACTCVIRGV